ncbi:hypothetical protein VDR60_18885 [Xanthomonas campestris pv. campestris]|nr:hypothetical protein [Xanthomonas campestris pv. campestris]MEB1840006.1 hypothetical protein [Xanthomonas campestris pv. campestris]
MRKFRTWNVRFRCLKIVVNAAAFRRFDLMRTAKQLMQNLDLSALIEEARNAAGVKTRTPAGFDAPTRITPEPIQRFGQLALDQPVSNLASFFDANGRLRRVPPSREAITYADVKPLEIARATSRCAAAGAHLLLREEAIAPKANNGIPVFQREVSGFSLVEPARLAPSADGAAIPATVGMPIKTASVDWSDQDTAQIHAIRFEISRAQLRKYRDEGNLTAIITASILAGVGQMADAVLLRALAAANLANFTIAAAATAGVSHTALRGLVGTAGAGATIADDGGLRAARVLAELTDATESTFVGAWANAAVLLDRSVSVVAERAGSVMDGGMVLTVLGSAVALVPDQSKFWKVAA